VRLRVPRKAKISENLGLDIIRVEPSKLNAPLVLISFVDDLFRASELFIPSHLLHSFTEAASGESDERDGIKVLRLGLCAQVKAYGGISAGLPDPTPQRKELFRC
jgi:hypothetical protein